MCDHGAGPPAHRWTVTVVLLVALASLPTLAAVSAGKATLGQPAESDGTTPFIAQPPDMPVVIVPQRPATLSPPVSAVAEPARERQRRDKRKQRVRPQRRPVPPRNSPREATPRGASARPPLPAATAGPPACDGRPVLGWRPLTNPVPTCPESTDAGSTDAGSTGEGSTDPPSGSAEPAVG